MIWRLYSQILMRYVWVSVYIYIERETGRYIQIVYSQIPMRSVLYIYIYIERERVNIFLDTNEVTKSLLVSTHTHTSIIIYIHTCTNYPLIHTHTYTIYPCYYTNTHTIYRQIAFLTSQYCPCLSPPPSSPLSLGGRLTSLFCFTGFETTSNIYQTIN